jgi:hypothetical protein
MRFYYTAERKHIEVFRIVSLRRPAGGGKRQMKMVAAGGYVPLKYWLPSR